MGPTSYRGNAGDGGDRSAEVVRAAGCLVYRWTGGRPEVLVAHRPRYDDWDFPKGKLEPGETELACAVRETEEETGYTGEIGAELPTDHYLVAGRDGGPPRPKTVRWWLLQQTGGRFEANEEVDEVRWLGLEEAAAIVSYEHAGRLLALLPDVLIDPLPDPQPDPLADSLPDLPPDPQPGPPPDPHLDSLADSPPDALLDPLPGTRSAGGAG